MRLLVMASFCIAMLMLCSCQSLADRIGKGRPAGPPPDRFSGEHAEIVEIVEWIHPHVFKGEFERKGREQAAIFIEVEKLEGYWVDEAGVIHIPWWIGVAWFPDDDDSTAEERTKAAERHPPGSEIVVSFPLKGKSVVADGEPQTNTVLVTNGYLIRIEE